MNQTALAKDSVTRSNLESSGSLSVYELFSSTAARYPEATAIQSRAGTISYAGLLARANALAAALRAENLGPGDRIAIFSENRSEYIELHLACARIGAIVACQNWRLTPAELDHCVRLVEPSLVIYSERHADLVKQAGTGRLPTLQLGQEYEMWLSRHTEDHESGQVHWESGLLILYTSGTTGPAKAALISHRALVSRMTVLSMDLDINREDGFLAWSPMFHIGGSEHSLSTLMMGGTVFVSDGFDADFMADVIAEHQLGWLLLVPAMADRLKEAVARRNGAVRGVKAVGSMPDLVPKSSISELSRLFNAPFFNTFGSTETGLPPASGDLIPVGATPDSLGKKLSSMCALRIVDEEGEDVPAGGVGQALVRGPTLFSGYWGAADINARDFGDGWFRMGDLFRRNHDGTFDFVGRSKYLIKSGGENIYPAEIENLLMSDPGVSDAVVVRQQDSRWGEVPVAVVSRVDDTVLQEDLLALCSQRLAGYKQPKALYFVGFDDFPRNSNGKIIRERVEQWLNNPSSPLRA